MINDKLNKKQTLVGQLKICFAFFVRVQSHTFVYTMSTHSSTFYRI